MSGPATLADLRKLTMARVRKIGQTFRRPDDDWPMFMLVQSPHGVEAARLPNYAMATGHTKNALADALRAAMVSHGVFRYALLINAHGIRFDDDDREQADKIMARVRAEQVRIEQLEGAWELLGLAVGDAESEEYWTAEIRRTPRMIRTLGPWERQDDKGDATVAGRFAHLGEVLREGSRT